jgi:flagella basal body P-ring formation protein FlgA
MTPFALFALACIGIGSGSDHIVAGDLASAMPEFKDAPPDRSLALAPAPGVQRVFRIPELQRLAAMLNVTVAPENELCFERRLAPLDPVRLLAAMQRELPQARIEIIEHSRFQAPDGEIQFPISGLRQTPAAGFWSGAVRYAGARKFAIWARVKVTVAAARVVAAEPLKAGREISASQLRIEMRDEFPSAASHAASIDQLAGRVSRRNVKAGETILTQWTEAVKDVARGDKVRVEVRSGGAVLEFEGKAETAGFAGQTIVILNPASKKRFQARVEGRGRAVVKGIL